MTRNQAQQRIDNLAEIVMFGTINRAQDYLGSRNYCLRYGVDPDKYWAVCCLDNNFIYEPNKAFRTLAELVEHCEKYAGYISARNLEF